MNSKVEMRYKVFAQEYVIDFNGRRAASEHNCERHAATVRSNGRGVCSRTGPRLVALRLASIRSPNVVQNRVLIPRI
jgi:hypothetical protein